MKVNIPVDYPAHLFSIIKYGQAVIPCARGDENQKFIFNAALFNHKSFYKPEQSERIRNRKFSIEINIPSGTYKLVYFKGVGEMAMNDINEWLCKAFYSFFVDYMNKRCICQEYRRNPGYDKAIWDFMAEYNVDDAQISYDYLYKHYYRYRSADPILSKRVTRLSRQKASCQLSTQ
jgi:hypothetical protein